MKIQAFGIVLMLFLALFGAVTSVSAYSQLPVYIDTVKVNGDELTTYGWNSLKTVFERDSELQVKVTIASQQVCYDSNNNVVDCEPVSNVEITAFLTGSKDKISDTTDPFTVQPDSVYTKTLTLKFPQRLQSGDYQLRILVSSPNSDLREESYSISVEAPADSVAIKDVVFSPNDKIQAGRALSASARLKNYGQVDEKDVKVVMSIPSLDVMATDYIDIDKDDTESSEDLFLRIPADAKSGTYDVEVTVTYADGDETTKATYPITVVADGQAQEAVSGTAPMSGSGTTTVAFGIQEQSVSRGANGVVYPLTLTNGANTAKTVTLDVSGANDWATAKVSPSNVIVLNAGESKQAYVYVAASENAAVGQHVFSVDVKVGDDTVKQVPLKADVLESASGSAWEGVKKALTIGVILLVVLVLVLAAAVLYQKRTKGSNKEDEQIAQTYY